MSLYAITPTEKPGKYRITTTVRITGVGDLDFEPNVSPDDRERIVKAFRNALDREVCGYHTVVTLHRNDVLDHNRVYDFGYITDEMMERLAKEMCLNEAFMEAYWLTLETLIAEHPDFEDVRAAIEKAKRWYESEEEA